MRALSILAVLAALGLGACTELSDKDRALITSASQNADAAKAEAAAAKAEAARSAELARQAQQSAQRASDDARAANEKADRMFQRTLRK
jgi:hypothetical protein